MIKTTLQVLLYLMWFADAYPQAFDGVLTVDGDHFYLDLAYVWTKANEYYQAYSLTDQDVAGAADKKVTNNFVATLGARF